MASFDWSGCPFLEIIPGKLSGAPLLENARLPMDAIHGLRAYRVSTLRSANSRVQSARAAFRLRKFDEC
jgi:hypothetical protein